MTTLTEPRIIEAITFEHTRADRLSVSYHPPRTRSLSEGIRIVLPHPKTASAILASTLSATFMDSAWIDTTMKLRFCTSMLHFILDPETNPGVDTNLVEKLQSRPFPFCLRLLKRYPVEGIPVLCLILLRELRECQKLTLPELVAFTREVMERFFGF